MKPSGENEQVAEDLPRHSAVRLGLVVVALAVFALAATGLHLPRRGSVRGLMAPVAVGLGAFAVVAAYMLWARRWQPGPRIGWSATGHVVGACCCLFLAAPSLWWGTPPDVMRCPLPAELLWGVAAGLGGLAVYLQRRAGGVQR